MTNQATHSDHTTAPFTPHAAILGWLWPGAGHMVIGEKRRGVAIMIGILFLNLSGLLIGGFDCVDRKEDRLWFMAQALNGPIAFGADYINQNVIKKQPPEQQLLSVGIGRVNEIGTLFIALAGLMNLAVILDALHFIPRRTPERRTGGRRAEDNPKDAPPPEASNGERGEVSA